MTNEEKQLLIKDLCVRVIYNTKVKVIGDWFYEEREPYDSILTFMIMKTFEENDNLSLIIKPYLRPMSSMTEEEKKIMSSCGFEPILHNTGYTGFGNKRYIDDMSFRFMVEFLNSHYFDYRGLIETGLALEAPEDMYKIE